MPSKVGSHLRSNVVGYLALFVALSGSAYAVNGPLAGRNTVGSADIINEEVRSADVLNESIRGEDVFEPSLSQVPSAANANQLGGIGASGYQQFCANGAIKRIVHVNGDAADFPSTYTSSATYVPFTFSCRTDNPLVTVKRTAVGTFSLSTWYGDLSLFGFVNVDPSSNGGSGADDFANIRFVAYGVFEVVVRDADGGTENADFTVLLP